MLQLTAIARSTYYQQHYYYGMLAYKHGMLGYKHGMLGYKLPMLAPGWFSACQRAQLTMQTHITYLA